MLNKKYVGVVYGGKSSEHEVSIQTAFSVLKEIDYNKFSVLPIFIDRNGEWFVRESIDSKEQLKDVSLDSLSLPSLKKSPCLFSLAKEIDIFFPLVHGPNGEDGTIQGLFEILNVPYVGSGVLGSSVGMDKITMKKILKSANVPQCKFLYFNKGEIIDNLIAVSENVERELGYPCFVKPSNAGSSIGITKAKNRNELFDALELALKFDRKILIEEAVLARELEVGILGNGNLKTSAVGEVKTTKEFYDYEAKYKNQEVTKIEIPANIPMFVAAKIEEEAKKICKELDCYGLSRVDFFWNEGTNELFINEVNTIPGFTPFSMYPLLFKEVGISYSELIEELISFGFEKFNEKSEIENQSNSWIESKGV